MTDHTGQDSTGSGIYKNVEKCLRNHLIIVNQFEVLERIGKGGCGTVLKVKSKTDCKFYALKLIPLSKSDEENKLMREVKVLASLNHENVIGYNTSWIIKTSKADDDLLEVPADSNYNGSSNMSSENSDNIVFKDLSSENSFRNSNEQPSNLNKDYSTEKNAYYDSELKFLCIQMEYCEQNLKEFIDKGKHFSDPEEQMRIMLEILNGLEYIHNQGVMHRDLKPSNIFLDKFGQVKIGDFGFARSSNREASLWQNVQEDENYNSIEDTSCPVFKRSNSLTNELGTYFYVSPEINKGLYDQRVDLYSLGIVIFELFYQFSTEMERLKILESIRQEQILLPDDVIQKFSYHSVVIDIVTSLLQHDPNNRAGIDEIRKKLTVPENEDMEESLEIGVEFERNSSPLDSEILQSIGCIRVKGKLRGLCFRVGAKYLLTTYTVIERIVMWKNCSVIFLNHKVPRKSATFQLSDVNPIKWATPENNLAILELNTAKPNLPPPYGIGCMEEHDDTLALVQVTELRPFKFEVRLLTDSEFTMMEGRLFYYGTILQPHNMGSPIIRISENGRNFVTGMVLANFYHKSQKTGTCIIDCQKIYETFSPMIPFDLRKEIFENSHFYKCHEHLMIKIEHMENEIKKMREITDRMIVHKKK